MNLYAYCNNDPVNYADPSGCFAIIVAGIIIGFGISAAASVVTQLEEHNGDLSKVDTLKVFYDGAFGAINGAVATSGIGLEWSVAVGAVSGFLSSIGSDLLFENGNISWGDAAKSFIIGGIAGAIAGAGANNVKDGMQVTKFINSRDILNRTISNGTKSAIQRQAYAYSVHAKQLLNSGINYMLSSVFSTVCIMLTN